MYPKWFSSWLQSRLVEKTRNHPSVEWGLRHSLGHLLMLMNDRHQNFCHEMVAVLKSNEYVSWSFPSAVPLESDASRYRSSVATGSWLAGWGAWQIDRNVAKLPLSAHSPLWLKLLPNCASYSPMHRANWVAFGPEAATALTIPPACDWSPNGVKILQALH